MTDTRTEILQKNFEAIHRNGFQGVRADKVVAEMGITKGALYHYFPNKFDLGYAILDELIAPQYLKIWKSFEATDKNFGAVLFETLDNYRSFAKTDEQIKLGCPLTNLTQEMPPLDEGFRKRLYRITNQMHQQIETGLKKAQLSGEFRLDFNPTQVAFFYLSTIEGGFSVSKAMQSRAIFEMVVAQLKQFTEGLKA
ncbi:TetR/AcrR family transcriptional regulator [Runella sp.]|uniref:TetR/AcrR family transcriptional regulator n=1 Tax=Runella sp. TaxID=1960881 RepID=UPI003D12EAD8